MTVGDYPSDSLFHFIDPDCHSLEPRGIAGLSPETLCQQRTDMPPTVRSATEIRMFDLLSEYARRTMFSATQRAAVRAAFQLAGYEGSLNTLPLDSDGEVCFVLDQEDVLRLDVHLLEQEVQQILGRKIWVLASVYDKTVPFD